MSKKTWDVIVVGAGSAGAAFALRTAQRGASVLLLEAGPDYRSHEMHEAWRAENPAVALLDPSASDGVVWPDLLATRTENQPAYPYWRGRGVGGSSSINGQIAIRPPMDDFLDWGIDGWSPEDVLPYFARLEDDEQFGAQPHHGAGGPIPVHRKSPDAWGSVDTALAAAGRAAGLPWSEDVNAPGATGVSPYPINSRGGRRVSVNDGYLEPGRTLPELEILGDTLVDRILFEGDRAVGVRCVRDGAEVDLHASTVVLSAGVIHSPAILLRSGIGPADDLAALGIEVRRDLPVGANLQDHPMTLVVLPLIESARIGTIGDRHTNVCIRWSSGEGECANDLMAVAMNQNVLAMAEADAGRSGGGFGVWLNQAHSRGTVKLASTDPRIHPTVEERMLSDQRDLRRMREGIRTVVDLALREEVAPMLSQPIAAANAELFAVIDDDALLDQYLLATVADAQHGTSTCRMGDPGDPSTVVGADGKVHGIDGLHVVDASILPAVPRANTNLTAIMIGELLADRIA